MANYQLIADVFTVVVWTPELNGALPKWGPSANNVYQASDDQGVAGWVRLNGANVRVHSGDYLVSVSGGDLVDVLSAGAFAAKYQVIV